MEVHTINFCLITNQTLNAVEYASLVHSVQQELKRKSTNMVLKSAPQFVSFSNTALSPVAHIASVGFFTDLRQTSCKSQHSMNLISDLSFYLFYKVKLMTRL